MILDLKFIFSKKCPGSKYMPCSSFMDRKYPKNTPKYMKKGHKTVIKIKERLKVVFNIVLKVIFSKI